MSVITAGEKAAGPDHSLADRERNGADALLEAMMENGISVCFANPGTSEMQFVSALDRSPGLRAVLCLFEGVATGAADGYARMADRPAATLLHLGPGYLNGGANLHNARRARSPILNVIGDHATYHRSYDTPLTSDIAAMARPNSKWVGSVNTTDEIGRSVSIAVGDAMTKPRGPVSLILPADTAWTAADKGTGFDLPQPKARMPEEEHLHSVVEKLRAAQSPAILLGGDCCQDQGLEAARKLEAAGIKVFTEGFVARQRRGRGIYSPIRMPYFAEAAVHALAGCDLLITVEAKPPVAFFAYPGRPSELLPEGCPTMALAGEREDGPAALEWLADAIGVEIEHPPAASDPTPEGAIGELNAHVAAIAIARHLPAESIISDDAVTSGQPIFDATREAAPHDWLMLTGGAIGQGLPVAIGAAVACPDRKVVSLNGDGAAMYTVQSLWTIAREQLDIVVVVFNNSDYRILQVEFSRTGSGDRPGPASARLLDLANPMIDWVSLGASMGIPGERCLTGEEFELAFARACQRPGPYFIEAVTGKALRTHLAQRTGE